MKKYGLTLVCLTCSFIAVGDDFIDATKSIVKQVNACRFLSVGTTFGGPFKGMASAAYTNDADIELQAWGYSDPMLWELEQVSDVQFAIKKVGYDFYLRSDAGTDGWGPGDRTELYSWQNWGSQKWYITHIGHEVVRINMSNSSYYLSISSNVVEAPVVVMPDNSSDTNQQWRIFMVETVDAPALGKAPDGSLLAFFRDKIEGSGKASSIYASVDEGKTWTLRCAFGYDIYAPTFFAINNELYMINIGSPDCSLTLRKSIDNGYSWSSYILKPYPDGAESGGGAAVAIIGGYLYYGFMESSGAASGTWPTHYKLVVASCSLDADLTQGGNWAVTDPLAFPSDPAVSGTQNGWLEPSCVQGPDGRIWVIARVDHIEEGNVAAVLKLSSDRQSLEFVNQYPAPEQETGFINAPWAGSAKFHIVYDNLSKRYIVMSNPYMGSPSTDIYHPYVRNILALYETVDLKNYSLVKTLLEDDYLEKWGDSSSLTGFQQPSFIIDGTTLRYLSRSAYKTFANYHEANMISYHELDNFRNYLVPDGEIACYSFDDSNNLGADSSKMHNSPADSIDVTYSTAGKYSGCALFGGNSSLKLMNRVSPKLHYASAVTVSLWCRQDIDNTGYLYSSSIDETIPGLELVVSPTTIRVGGRSCSTDEYQYLDFSSSQDGLWHHLVVQWDFAGGAIHLWVDNRPQEGVGTVSFGCPYYHRGAPAVQDRVGCSFQGSMFFKGAVDEFHIYRRSLSADERAHLFYGDTAGLFFGLRGASGF